MTNILVTGAEGQLGTSLKKIAGEYPQYNFIYTDKHNLDICDKIALESFFASNQIYCVLHFAAYTAVDKAEEEKELAELLNVKASENISLLCKQYSTRLIYISTDYVFDGNSSIPYLPSYKTNPLSVYGTTKLRGEEVCLQNNPLTFVVRTSWLYSEFKSNFVKTMIKLSLTRDSINVVYDQIGCPTYASDLAVFAVKLIEHIDDRKILHFSNQGVCSWYDLAKKAIELYGEGHAKIFPIRSEQYPTLATRPKYSVFDKSESEAILGISIPHWEDSLKECIKQIKIIGI
ncbi:MAG: dTDP-4-dehydrorhamnose reductase [Bacteroidales bacterium]|jgi:dTDP-4-dehydrorhamnose reductase|nr:dTDP-4-dehydrorhamnose reductase [Bacteroidales bacterium]